MLTRGLTITSLSIRCALSFSVLMAAPPLVSPKYVLAQQLDSTVALAPGFVVQLEGAIQASGVLIQRKGTTYTVLTSWPVVAKQTSPLSWRVVTADQRSHQVNADSIRRVPGDLAELSFDSSRNYATAQRAVQHSTAIGDKLLIAGFPLGPVAAKDRPLVVFRSTVVAVGNGSGVQQGQILSSALSLPMPPEDCWGPPPAIPPSSQLQGLVGGAVLDQRGRLLAIYAQSQRDFISESPDRVHARPRINRAVMLTNEHGLPATPLSVKSTSFDAIGADLERAEALLGIPGQERQLIQHADAVLVKQRNREAYLFKALAHYQLARHQLALLVINQAIAFKQFDAEAVAIRGLMHQGMGNHQAACSDWRSAQDLWSRNIEPLLMQHCETKASLD